MRVEGPGSRVQGSGSRVKGLGFRVQGSGSRVTVSRPRARPSSQHGTHKTVTHNKTVIHKTVLNPTPTSPESVLRTATPHTICCRANIAHIRQSRPDSGLGFQVSFQVFPSGWDGLSGSSLIPHWAPGKGSWLRVHPGPSPGTGIRSRERLEWV